MDFIPKLISFLVVAAFTVAIFIFIFTTNAFVIQCAWGWFITPAFDLAPVGWYHSFCLSGFAMACTFRLTSTEEQDKEQDPDQKLLNLLLRVASRPLFALLFLWLTHLAVEAYFN